MNSSRKFSTILISIQILYLLHLPTAISTKNKDNVKDKGRKLQNLPLVLMLQTENSEYSFPRCFRRYSAQGESEIVDFTTNSQNQQVVYFCPKSSTEKYLYPTDGKNYYCDEPPEPQIRLVAVDGCGKRRDSYSYGYKLFETPIDDQNASKTWKEIYSFCYDKENNQVAYLSYRILSPNLFGNRQLERERSYYEYEYRLGEIEDQSLKAYLASIMQYLDRKNKTPDFVQMELAHPADMIFPNWKKPFYHAANQGLLIPELKTQWRKIGKHFRNLAQQKLGELDIVTGTFPYKSNKKLFGIWWKLVIYKNKAIAIILHNDFIERPKKEKKGKRKGKRSKKGQNIQTKNETSLINNEMIENEINAKVEALEKEKSSTQRASTTTTNVISVAPSPQSDTKVVIEPSKNDANANGRNLLNSDTNFNGEPPKIGTDVNGNSPTNDTNGNGDPSSSYEPLCDDICHKTGFHGVANKELVVHAYCCDPKIITSRLGLKDYEILDLNQVLEKDAPALNDNCPKDPAKLLKSKDEKSSGNLNTASKLQT